jgi:hypothetical protein
VLDDHVFGHDVNALDQADHLVAAASAAGALGNENGIVRGNVTRTWTPRRAASELLLATRW